MDGNLLIKSIRNRYERQKLEMEMFLKRKNQSRKRLLLEMDDEDELAAGLGLCAVAIKKPRKVRDPDETRDTSWWENGYINWSDVAFKKRLRVNRATFQYLLGEIRNELEKETTKFKPVPIPPHTRLAICLYRLAHGCTYNTVGDLFGVAESTAAVIFNEVCKILVSAFYDQFVKLPRDSSEWKQELRNFLENWEFPCVGAWDGFHVYISTKLKNYFSFKKRYSVSCMGFIASNKKFFWAAVGAPGSTHDSRLLRSCTIFDEIQKGCVFPNAVLRTSEYGDIPFITVGDSAFPRLSWLMKPYDGSTRDPRKRYFNKRLCSARVVTEHAYGMLKGRWRVLYKKTECRLKNIRHIIMACIALHNICIEKNDPCKPRWRLEVKKLDLIHSRGNKERNTITADQVRSRVTDWLWDIRQQRQHII
jgi:hypothetical protein